MPKPSKAIQSIREGDFMTYSDRSLLYSQRYTVQQVGNQAVSPHAGSNMTKVSELIKSVQWQQ